VIKKMVVGCAGCVSTLTSDQDQLGDVIRVFRKDTSIGLKEASDFVRWVFDHGTIGQEYYMVDGQGKQAGIKIDDPFPIGAIIKYLDNGKLGKIESHCSDTCEKLHCSLMGERHTRYNLLVNRLVMVAHPGTELAKCYDLLNAAAGRAVKA